MKNISRHQASAALKKSWQQWRQQRRRVAASKPWRNIIKHRGGCWRRVAKPAAAAGSKQHQPSSVSISKIT